MKKITLMLGILALAAFPAVASADYNASETPGSGTAETFENSTLTLNVMAAVELSTPANDTESQAPTSSLNTSNTLSNTVTFNQASNIRSNLSWSVAVTGDAAFAKDGAAAGGGLAERTTGLSSAAISKGSGNSGSRNSSNATQSAATASTQQVSWADQAGIYTAGQTHTATQSLPAVSAG